jgi:hypothetical protein
LTTWAAVSFSRRTLLHCVLLVSVLIYPIMWFLCSIAANCNKKKYQAKRAGEQSIELYFTVYIGLHGPMVEEAVVMDVKDLSFDTIVLSTGQVQRIYTNVSIVQVQWLRRNSSWCFHWAVCFSCNCHKDFLFLQCCLVAYFSWHPQYNPFLYFKFYAFLCPCYWLWMLTIGCSTVIKVTLR